MTRKFFDRELQDVRERILILASEVERNVRRSVTALLQRNVTQSRDIIAADEWINEKRIRIGMDCLSMLSRQQPVAGDLRQIATYLEISGELERIHDYAKGIGKINLLIGQEVDLGELPALLPEMAHKATLMLHQALVAFSVGDAALARAIPRLDDEVDALYDQLNLTVLNHIVHHPDDIAFANRLLWAGHNLERAADRVTNVCEWIVYMVTGQYVEMDTKMPLDG